jgi:hypothetical protein
VLTNAGTATSIDVFVTKLTDAGNTASFTWTRQVSGTKNEYANAISVNNAGVYIAGAYGSAEAKLGNATLANSSANNTDLTVAKIDDMGATSSFAWAQHAGGIGSDNAQAVVLNGSRIYVAGSVTPAASFGSLSVATPVNYQTSFLASLIDPIFTATTAALHLESISLLPNPAHGRAAIRIPIIPGTSSATLTVLDALGHTVRTQPAATNSKAELDLMGLMPGLYAVRVVAGNHAVTRRLLVE